MNSCLIELKYIKKSILFVLLLGFISFGSIGGCSDNGGGNTKTFTENDFADDSMLRADPEKGNVVDFLESPNSESTENDTGVAGVDEIPLRYERTVEHTFCWEDENIDAMHFMELLDSERTEILRVDVNGDCATEVIEPGEYVMSIHHDGSMDTSLPVFIIPNENNDQQAIEKNGLIIRIKVALSNLLRGIQNTIYRDAAAQSEDDQPQIRINRLTLLLTRSCTDCLLVAASFDDQDLSGVNLRGADLRFASFIRTNLTGADFSGADVRNAIMFDADLTDVDLTGADITDTEFGLATWCDGSCTCNINNSVGMCDGCPPVDICIGDGSDVPPQPPCVDDLDCTFGATCIDGLCCSSGGFTFCETVQDCNPDNCQAPFFCDESQGDDMCCATQPPEGCRTP